MIVLGIHRDPWHNTGAAIIRADGKSPQVAMLSEERLDCIKDSRAFPTRSIEACLREVGLKSIREVDLIVLDYIRTPDWRTDFARVRSAEATLLDEIDPVRIHVINHHLAHSASTYFSSTFEDAAILIVDGRGSENETQSLFVGEKRTIRRVASTDTIGIGLFYAAATQKLGFGLLQEGKTMGLAPYGRDLPGSYLKISPRFDGIVTDYSDYCIEDSYELRIDVNLTSDEARSRFAFETQAECEKALLHLVAFAKKTTGKSRLCLSGGVALNSVGNFRILESGLFEDIFINPACSDTGIPLGAALYGYHVIAGQPRFNAEISPYLGPSYSVDEFENAALTAASRCKTVRDNVLDAAAALLADNRIVAHCSGRSEMGPRALGNRSILMSPIRAENKDTLNSRVKHREAFRPFAPVCLESEYQKYFELDRPSPYMLLVPDVVKEKRCDIPAVTHVDGTGRLQTVNERENARLHKLIQLFGVRTGVPVLLNTSFNDNGQPIVETPMHAVSSFLKMDIDALLLGDLLLIKNEVNIQG